MISSIFDGDTGISYEQLQAKKALARAMLARANGRLPRNMGEGMSHLGGVIGGIGTQFAAQRDEKKNAEYAREVMAGLFPGSGDFSPAPAPDVPVKTFAPTAAPTTPAPVTPAPVTTPAPAPAPAVDGAPPMGMDMDMTTGAPAIDPNTPPPVPDYYAGYMRDTNEGVTDDKIAEAWAKNWAESPTVREVWAKKTGGPTMTPPAPVPTTPAPVTTTVAPSPVTPVSGTNSTFWNLLDRTEGGGSYDTLFGYANKAGGPFAGTKISEMPVKDVLAFAAPSGAYGQHVKGKIGRVATPMGRGQIVGTTLRNVAGEMGLTGNETFNADLQNRMVTHLAQRRLRPGMSQEAKRAALRSEWSGFKGASNADLDRAIAEIEGGTAVAGAPSGGGGAYRGGGGGGIHMAGGGDGYGAGGGQPVDRGYMRRLLMAASDPRLPPQYRQIIGIMLQQEMARNKPMDPYKAFQMDMARRQAERADKELAWKMGGGNAKDPLAKARALAEASGLTPGTKEYNDAVVKYGSATGGNVTVNNTMPNGVTLPKPPKDHLWQRNPDGTPFIGENGLPVAVPVPGGPADVKAADAAAKEAGRESDKKTYASIASEDIDRAIALVEEAPGWRTGFLGQAFQDVGGTGAHRLNLALRSIKGYVSRETLQKMRDNSPTGGALGNVTEKELRMLESAYGALEQSGSADDLVYNLKRFNSLLNEVVHGGDAPKQAPADGEPPSGAVPPIPDVFKGDKSVEDAWPHMTPEERQLFMGQ